MARRLAYAYILVHWPDRSIEQVIAVVAMTTVQVCYLAHARPNQETLNNRIDLTNEVTIMLCTYCMLTFTGLVLQAETRYKCGWVLIGLLLGPMIGFNLVIVLYLTLKNLLTTMRLRLKKKRNRKLMHEKVSILHSIRRHHQ